MTIADPSVPSVFTDGLAGFADRLIWSGPPPDGAEPVAAASLLPHLQCHHRGLGGGPFAATCSLWLQSYANTLLIPAVCVLADGTTPACRTSAVTACFSPWSGHAERFLLQAGQPTTDRAAAVCSLVRLLDRHLDGIAAALQESSGLSPRVTWENIGGTLAWAVREVARVDACRGERLHRLLTRLPLRSELGSRLRRAVVEGPRRRRTCCLRYRIPGVAACPDICPRAAAAEPTGGGRTRQAG